jgi:hypothetical protein
VPEPCKVVTLDASKVRVRAPLAAVTAASFAILLLDEVVNRSYEDIVEPSTVTVSDFVEEFVLTAMRTTSEGPL